MEHYKALIGLSGRELGKLYNRLPWIYRVMKGCDKSLDHEAVERM